jgi:hypothetical protein
MVAKLNFTRNSPIGTISEGLKLLLQTGQGWLVIAPGKGDALKIISFYFIYYTGIGGRG